MGASIAVERPLEWMDTDAAGIWHYSTVIRFAEHAEYLLHQQLGITKDVFGKAPRAHVEYDFVAPVRFGDIVTTTFTVSRVGRTSIAYEVVLSDGPATDGGTVYARGAVITVLTDAPGGRPIEVPDDLRAALEG